MTFLAQPKASLASFNQNILFFLPTHAWQAHQKELPPVQYFCVQIYSIRPLEWLRPEPSIHELSSSQKRPHRKHKVFSNTSAKLKLSVIAWITAWPYISMPYAFLQSLLEYHGIYSTALEGLTRFVLWILDDKPLTIDSQSCALHVGFFFWTITEVPVKYCSTMYQRAQMAAWHQCFCKEIHIPLLNPDFCVLGLL